MSTIRALAVNLAIMVAFLFLAGCGGSGNEAPTTEDVPSALSPTVPQAQTLAPSSSLEAADPSGQPLSSSPVAVAAEPERRAVYNKAAEVLQDGTLSYSERRNRLRLVRRSFGDDLFFAVIGDVPVYDTETGLTVAFADYMADLAGTFVGHPQGPITFDPVGAATRIYFSPTEETIRRMTGIGITEDRVAEYSFAYRAEESEREQAREVAIAVEAPPPAFVSRDPELRETYERARTILTNGNETNDSRREKMRILQQEVGHEKITLLMRYLPIVDLENGTVETFDNYVRNVASSYDAGTGSPLEQDPVGAGMRLFFDPSPDTIAAMTGIGLSEYERSENSQQYEQEQDYVGEAINQIVGDTLSRFNWGEVHQATEDSDSGIVSIWGDN